MTGRVFVVGSVNADLLVRLPHLPSPGETVLGGHITRAPGGKGANQAVAAARLGVPTSLVAAVGTDDEGERSLADLRASGVDVTGVVQVDEPTGVGIVLVAEDGENAIAVASGANERLAGDVVHRQLGQLTADDVVVANLEVSDAAVAAAAAESAARGARFVLNPAPARQLSRGLLARTDVLTPNRVEVRELGFAGPAELLATGLAGLVVTLGADGADLYRAGHRVVHQAPFVATVVDTTGAGDAFTAGLAAALASGEPLEVAIRWAAAVGAMATRALGARAAYPGGDELADMLRDASHGRQSAVGEAATSPG